MIEELDNAKIIETDAVSKDAAIESIAVEGEDTSRDAAILSAARSAAARVNALAGSENVEALRNAVADLQSLAGQGSSKIQGDLSAIASSASSTSSAVEENYRNEDALDLQAMSQSYSHKYPAACHSKKMKSFLMNELSGESYASAKVTVDGNGEVSVAEGEEIKGEVLRDDFESVAKHSLSAEEEKKLEAETNQEIDVDKQEAKKLHGSLERLESFRAAKIMEGEGTEEEKHARLQKMHERFERAHEQTDKACDEHECQHSDREHAPQALRPSLKQYHDQNATERKKLREMLKEDVLPDVMGEERTRPSRGREAGRSENKPPPVAQMPPQPRSGGFGGR